MLIKNPVSHTFTQEISGDLKGMDYMQILCIICMMLPEN